MTVSRSRLKKLPLVRLVGEVLKRPQNIRKPRIMLQLGTIALLLFICYIFGLFTHLLEQDLSEFRHPLKIDIRFALQTLYKDEASVKYLDVNNLNYSFIHKADERCRPVALRVGGGERVNGEPYLVILVKSKLTHFEHRDVIRKTWGASDPMKLIRTVFLVGVPSPSDTASGTPTDDIRHSHNFNIDIEALHHNEAIVHQHQQPLRKSPAAANKRNRKEQEELKQEHEQEQQQQEKRNAKAFEHLKNNTLLYQLELEYEQYGDIVQQNFHDTYYNNTVKTFMGIRWINEYCSNAKFYLFIDDDFYLNPGALMAYLSTNVSESQMATYYAGYVFDNSSPMRHLLSKWYISLKDYPYHKFPPYVAAGCYLLTRQSANLFHMASKLIELFKFDDIYMGILAHKLDIKPLHLDMVHFYAPTYYPSVYVRDVIAAHGFSTADLLDMWKQLEPMIKFKPTLKYLL